MMRMILTSKGHVVIEAADGRAALEQIEKSHPDIALIDIGLPMLSGYEVAQKIRQNPVLDDVLLVALTGYGRDNDIKTARAAGFDDHFTKPANSDRLDQILLQQIHRKAS